MAAANTDHFRKSAPFWSTTLNGAITSSTNTITLQGISGLPTGTGVTLVIDAKNAQGALTPSLQETITGVVSAGTSSIINALRGVEGTAQAHANGANVYAYITAADWNSLMDGILAQHNQDGTHNAITASSLTTGSLTVSSGLTLPNASLLNAMFNLSITTGTNPGSAGGTTNYINLGGLKVCWGTTALQTITSGSQAPLGVTFPITFTAIPEGFAQEEQLGVVAQLKAWTDTPSTSAANLEFYNPPGTSTGTVKAFWMFWGN